MNKTRLIPPFVMLLATAAVAVITYLRDFPFDRWLVLVFGVMVFFLFFGEVILQLIDHFVRVNEEKARLEAEQAAEGDAGETGDQEAGGAPDALVSDLPPVE